MKRLLKNHNGSLLALFFLLVFLTGNIIVFTHAGAPVVRGEQTSPCPYSAVEWSCGSGIGHHIALSQHLITILPQIVFGLLFLAVFTLLGKKTAMNRALSAHCAIQKIAEVRLAEPSLFQELFARGILHPKKY